MTSYVRNNAPYRDNVKALNNLNNYQLNNPNSVTRTRDDKLSETISVKDFGAVGDGVTEDYTAINNAISAMTAGSVLIFPPGTYLISTKITALLKTGVSIICHGTLKFDGLAECIEFSGLNVNVYINKINCVNSCGTAVIIKSCMRSEFDIREINGRANITDAGIKLVGRYANIDGSGNSLNGCIYNIIRARTIQVNTATANGMTITTEYNGGPGYVNECEIYAQWITANNGIKHVKGTGQTDRFNSNKYMFIGLEGITTDGIYMEYTIRNVIHSPRFESVGQYQIYEGADNFQNTYFLTYSHFHSQISMNGKSARIIGNGRDDAGGVIYREAWQDPTGTFIYITDNYSANMQNNTVYFDRDDNAEGYFNKWLCGVKDGNGNLRDAALLDPVGYQSISGTSGTITIQDDISFIRVANDGGNVSLLMPEIKEVYGITVLLDVYFFNSSNTLEVLRSDSSINIATGSISGQGLYTLTYRDDTWVASYIGNPTSSNPGKYEGTITWDPANLVDGGSETSSDITVSDGAVSDSVTVFPPYNTQGVKFWGYVSATNTVKIRLENNTGGDVNLASGVWKVRVIKR